MVKALAFREIADDDIDELAALVADAFVGYRAFAPTGWRPPLAGEQASGLRDWIADPGFWGELAAEGRTGELAAEERAGELAAEERTLVGHATFIPATRHSFRAAPDPSLAHLGHLFVKPSHWGSGVATQLLDHATSAAASRGFTGMRLFVPAGQARARRFYAREGFVAVGAPFEFGLGLPVLEYRRPLESPAGGVAARPAVSN